MSGRIFPSNQLAVDRKTDRLNQFKDRQCKSDRPWRLDPIGELRRCTVHMLVCLCMCFCFFAFLFLVGAFADSLCVMVCDVGALGHSGDRSL